MYVFACAATDTTLETTDKDRACTVMDVPHCPDEVESAADVTSQCTVQRGRRPGAVILVKGTLRHALNLTLARRRVRSRRLC